jgi:hypothetical protein
MDAVLFSYDTVQDTVHKTFTTKWDTIVNRNILSGMGEGNDVLVRGNRVIVLDNGASNLYVLTADSMRILATIPFGNAAPNKMAMIGEDSLIVTRRNAPSAAIVDLNRYSVVDSIPLGGASLAVAIANNEAYITTGDSEYTGPFFLQIYNLGTKKITKVLSLPGSPEEALSDSNGFVMIETDGDYVSLSPKIYFVEPGADILFDSVSMGTPNSTAVLCLGSGPSQFVLLDNKVYHIPSAGSGSLGSSVIVSNDQFYHGFCDAEKNEIYLGVYDFKSGSGKVEVYDASTYAYKWSFPTGIAPAHFAFYH